MDAFTLDVKGMRRQTYQPQLNPTAYSLNKEMQLHMNFLSDKDGLEAHRATSGV
jgi:hypothetical protein